MRADRPQASLLECLEGWAAVSPGAPAILAPGRPALGRAQLVQQVRETIAALGAAGLGRDDRVALVLPQEAEMVAALLGVAAGAVCAPLHPGHREGEYEALLTGLGSRALIAPAGRDTAAARVARRIGLPVLALSAETSGPAGRFALDGRAAPAPALTGPGRHRDVALVLHTSGTTARPKRVALTHAHLLAGARALASTLDLAEADRLLSLMPLFHIHGIMTCLAALLSGGSLARPPVLDPWRMGEWLETLRPTWYSAVPTIHRAIVDHAGLGVPRAGATGLRFIRSSSAPLPPALAQRLEALFGAPVVEAYGMTEATHQIASNPLPPAPRRPGSVGRPAGAEVAVVDAEGRPVPAGQTGEVVIRGPAVIGAYEGDPEATRAGFREGWLRTGDLGHLDADGYLFLTGRIKELINRGGEKVAPAEVEAVLASHPAVAEAAVFPAPHPTLGEEVAAAVVLRPGAAAAQGALRAWVAERLAEFKAPGRVLVVERIPTGATGKWDRHRLAQQLGLGGVPPAAPGSAPAAVTETPLAPGATQATLAGIWQEVLGLSAVGPDDDFFALGGDSLRAMLVASRVRAALGVEMPVTCLLEAPTLGALAARLGAGSRPRPATPEPPGRDGRLAFRRASFAQERFWVLDALGGGLAHSLVHLRLHGNLDADALRLSLQTIVDRHDALRTTFRLEEGGLYQRVAPALALDVPLMEIPGPPGPGREAHVEQAAREVVDAPFDLERGPLLRGRLLRLGPQEHVLLLAVHHAVWDGWSRRVLARELSVLYRAFLAGRAAPLPPLPAQYADFAEAERRCLEGSGGADLRRFWRQEIGARPADLELPTDRRRQRPQPFRAASQTSILPGSLGDALRALAEGHRVTLFQTLLAGLQVVLQRYVRADEIVVGAPVAGRTAPEWEGLIGCFVNTLILRGDLAGAPDFVELLQRARHTVFQALDHQDLPFEAVAEELGLPPAGGLRVLFNMLSYGPVVPDLPGLRVEAAPPLDAGTTFDLALYATEAPAGLTLRAVYNAELFHADTAARVLGHLGTVLEAAASDPRRPVHRLPLLTRGEETELARWNDRAAPYPDAACVQDLVAAQAARTPDAVAVAAGAEAVTYADLLHRASRLADRLQREGVGPDALVGVCLGRSPALLVALLGVLRAGGTFLPLDPTLPRERLAFLVEDSRPRLLLTREPLRSRLPADAVPVLSLDEAGLPEPGADEPPGDGAGPWPAAPPTSRPAPSPDSLAYVNYTSGSTGRPKGVLVPHRGVVNYLTYLARTYALGPGDVVLPLASIGFDASVRELFAPLTVGARIVLLDDDATRSPDAVVSALRSHRVTALLAVVPTMLRELTAAAEHGGPAASLRLVLTTGETLRAADWQRARETLCPGALVVNQYGPTECTMTCTYHPLGPADEGLDPLPVGRPIPNVTIHVLDPAGGPVPAGVPGEVYVGGVGVTRGYLGRPSLTVERFVTAPGDGGACLYRTGDIARHRADGVLELLGRADDQVKIRGLRVEPGEIEAVLAAHPGVRAAAVALREDRPGDQRLVAYIRAATDRPPSAADLRGFLRRQLPAHMVPGQVCVLDAFPLTPSGKVDRRALPAPGPAREDAAGAAAPRTPLEATLAEAAAALLGIDRVGVTDDFFDLGGHSLLAMRLLALARREAEVDVPLRAFFENPTVAGLADAVLAARAARTSPEHLQRLVAEIQSLSDDEARRLLDEGAA